MATDLSTRLREILDRYDALTDELSQPEIHTDSARLQVVAREQAGLGEHAALAREWFELERGLADSRALLQESGGDPEMETLAREEIASLEQRRDELQARLVEELQERDPNDDKNVIVEIRAGTGGDEAALFAADLYRMYTRY